MIDYSLVEDLPPLPETAPITNKLAYKVRNNNNNGNNNGKQQWC
jgi:hypothetical protein